jgi:hypothetical protein
MIRTTKSTPSSLPSQTPPAPPEQSHDFLPQVGLLALDRQYATLRDEIRAAIERVCDSGRFVLGPDVADLETELARVLCIPHAISCASGSDALLLALMAIDIKPGDEVILPSYTFFATASAVHVDDAHGRVHQQRRRGAQRAGAGGRGGSGRRGGRGPPQPALPDGRRRRRAGRAARRCLLRRVSRGAPWRRRVAPAAPRRGQGRRR